jgi:hypothetical protein
MATLTRVGRAVAKAERGFGAIGLEIDTPTRPEDIAKRHHNRFAKEAMKRVLTTHHEKRIPGHFTKAAHQKYGYKTRTLKYMKAKARKYHSTTDLIKTGTSQRQMTSPSGRKITVGGAAEGGKKSLEGTLTMRFAWPGGSGRFRKENTIQEVTAEQMKKEMQATTAEERQQMAKQFLHEYFAQVEQYRGSRKRVRMPK